MVKLLVLPILLFGQISLGQGGPEHKMPDFSKICDSLEQYDGRGDAVKEVIESRKEGAAVLRAQTEEKRVAFVEALKSRDKEAIKAASDQWRDAMKAERAYSKETRAMIREVVRGGGRKRIFR